MAGGKGRRGRRYWIGAAIGIVIVGTVAVRVVQATADRPQPPTVEEVRVEQGVPVTVAPVERGALAIWREYSGEVSGVREAVVRARTGDQVSDVLVEVGDAVREGQVLVRHAGEATAARIRQAEAARRQAESTMNRMRPLHEAGAISEQEWDQVVTAYELAEADLAAVRDVAVLTSPLTGTVTEVLVRPGMIPSPGDPLVRVADLSGFVVRARINAADAAAIREGQPARLPNGATGAVQRIALQADPATRLVEIEVAFPKESGLIAGTLATVQVQIAEREDAIWVPRAAVRDGRVWVVEGGIARSRAVTTGLEDDARVEILDGLQAGEQVVVEGGSLLSEGARARVINGGSSGNV